VIVSDSFIKILRSKAEQNIYSKGDARELLNYLPIMVSGIRKDVKNNNRR